MTIRKTTCSFYDYTKKPCMVLQSPLGGLTR